GPSTSLRVDSPRKLFSLLRCRGWPLPATVPGALPTDAAAIVPAAGAPLAAAAASSAASGDSSPASFGAALEEAARIVGIASLPYRADLPVGAASAHRPAAVHRAAPRGADATCAILRALAGVLQAADCGIAGTSAAPAAVPRAASCSIAGSSRARAHAAPVSAVPILSDAAR